MVQFLLLTGLFEAVYSALSITSISSSTTVYFDFSVTVTIGSGECNGENLVLSSSLGTLQGTTSQTIESLTTFSITDLYLTVTGLATITAQCSSGSTSDTSTITINKGKLYLSLSTTVNFI
jgi:hypothetical protein